MHFCVCISKLNKEDRIWIRIRQLNLLRLNKIFFKGRLKSNKNHTFSFKQLVVIGQRKISKKVKSNLNKKFYCDRVLFLKKQDNYYLIANLRIKLIKSSSCWQII